jgi:hypothetical protein
VNLALDGVQPRNVTLGCLPDGLAPYLAEGIESVGIAVGKVASLQIELATPLGRVQLRARQTGV